MICTFTKVFGWSNH